jgi:hypothetical protein
MQGMSATIAYRPLDCIYYGSRICSPSQTQQGKKQLDGLADPDSSSSRDALASSEKIDQQDNNCQGEEEMDEAMHRHARQHPDQPKGEENYHNRV